MNTTNVEHSWCLPRKRISAEARFFIHALFTSIQRMYTKFILPRTLSYKNAVCHRIDVMLWQVDYGNFAARKQLSKATLGLYPARLQRVITIECCSSACPLIESRKKGPNTYDECQWLDTTHSRQPWPQRVPGSCCWLRIPEDPVLSMNVCEYAEHACRICCVIMRSRHCRIMCTMVGTRTLHLDPAGHGACMITRVTY